VLHTNKTPSFSTRIPPRHATEYFVVILEYHCGPTLILTQKLSYSFLLLGNVVLLFEQVSADLRFLQKLKVSLCAPKTSASDDKNTHLLKNAFLGHVEWGQSAWIGNHKLTSQCSALLQMIHALPVIALA
jgi:hypothetical protein